MSSDRVRLMSILVTVSVNLADAVTLRDIRQFVEAAERNGADPDIDLREYDENNDLVGLAAVGELDGGDADDESDADESDADESDADESDADDESDDHPVATNESSRQS
jgi:Ran GTPase-activating protein (RanGAP) involved in mRNA processing and transport